MLSLGFYYVKHFFTIPGRAVMDFLPLQRKDALGRGQVAGRSREWTVLDLPRGPTTIKTECKDTKKI